MNEPRRVIFQREVLTCDDEPPLREWLVVRLYSNGEACVSNEHTDSGGTRRVDGSVWIDPEHVALVVESLQHKGDTDG